MKSRQRGVYEGDSRGNCSPGSGVWWINCYVHGKRYREKGGSYADACALYAKRKAQGLRTVKLPELVAAGTFGGLIDATLEYAQTHTPRSWKSSSVRLGKMRATLGPMPAESVTRRSSKNT